MLFKEGPIVNRFKKRIIDVGPSLHKWYTNVLCLLGKTDVAQKIRAKHTHIFEQIGARLRDTQPPKTHF